MTKAQWVDYCCRTWPDLPREAVEHVADRPDCKTVYHVRQAVLRLLDVRDLHSRN